VAVEREVKLAAAPGFVLPDLTVTADGLPVAVLPEQRLVATYYDTPDVRLGRWGITVRHRSGEAAPGWTVKLPVSTDGGDVTRRETNYSGAATTVPEAVTKLLHAYVRSDVLHPIAKLVTRRRRVEIRNGEGAALVEVDDDEVSVLDGRRVAGRFREIEVEVRHPDGAHGLLDAVAGRLREAGAVASNGSPKLVQALGGRALAPPDVALVALDDSAPAGRAVQAAITAGVVRLLRHDPGVRLGDDPEDVHQARVATRRMRSDLRTFRDLVDPEWVGPLRDELRWIAGELGAVRDGDVLLERLERQAGALPPEDARAAGTLLRRLERERDTARTSLLAALSSERYIAVLDSLVAAAAAPQLTPEAGEKAAVVLPGIVARPWRHLERAVEELGDDPSDPQLHEVRIRAKRARYAAEAAAPVIGKPAKRLAVAIAELQTVLGDLQDAAVAEEWLRRAATSMRGGPAVVAGQLVAAQHVEMAKSRRAWPKAWAEASRKKLRDWLD
jgi:CHAD domain-containing protein